MLRSLRVASRNMKAAARTSVSTPVERSRRRRLSASTRTVAPPTQRGRCASRVSSGARHSETPYAWSRASDAGTSSHNETPSGVVAVATRHSAPTMVRRTSMRRLVAAAASQAATMSTPPSATAPCRFAQTRNSGGSTHSGRRRTSTHSVAAHIASVRTCGRTDHPGLDAIAAIPTNATRAMGGPGVSRRTKAHAAVTAAAHSSVRSGIPPSAYAP